MCPKAKLFCLKTKVEEKPKFTLCSAIWWVGKFRFKTCIFELKKKGNYKRFVLKSP